MPPKKDKKAYDDTQSVLIRLPIDVHRQLKHLAADYGTTIQKIGEKLFTDFVNRHS